MTSFLSTLTTHHWHGETRQRCSSCQTIRSRNPHHDGWIYCGPGEEPTTRDPGCHVRLPGAIGVPHVDD